MNVLVFIAGVSVGWIADRLYSSYNAKKPHGDKENEPLKVESEEKDIAEKKVQNEKKLKKVKKKKTKSEKNKTEKKESLTEKKSLTKKESLEEIHDDLSQLKGVGPKLAQALDAIGIYNYEQLSEPSIDTLLERLRGTGSKFSRSAISDVMKRAKQAAEQR